MADFIRDMGNINTAIEDMREELEDWLIALQQQNYWDMYMPTTGCYIEVRLRYVEGNMYHHSGSPQYDQDHRGAWAYGVITPDNEPAVVLDEMVEELKENYHIWLMETMSREEKSELDRLEHGDQLGDLERENYQSTKNAGAGSV